MLEPEILEPAPLAYENPDFLNSADGRILRILAEYSEPLSRFRREKIQDTVVFFGSARFASLSDAESALEPRWIWLATMRKRASWRTCSPIGPWSCLTSGIVLW